MRGVYPYTMCEQGEFGLYLLCIARVLLFTPELVWSERFSGLVVKA